MPTKPQQQFTAWSYSRLGDWEKCPLMAKLKHLDKRKEPSSPAMARGASIDELCTKFITGQLKKLPPELANFKAEFAGLLKVKRLLNAQQDLALTRAWTPTGWFDADAWLRIKMDVYYDLLDDGVRRIIDFKTGKIREEHEDQLELYAVGGLAYASEAIGTFETSLWYLDQGETNDKTFTRREAEALKGKWEKRVRPMLADRAFKPTPGNACRWCFFGQSGKAKGGPGCCKF